MLIDIEKIVVGDRIRKDFGDIDELAQDIKDNGLINPPVVNKSYELLAGERRLKACRQLGWNQIEVRMMDTRDAEHELNIEISENDVRKGFTKSERLDYIRRLLRIEQAKASERELAGVKDPSQNSDKGRSDEATAAAFGISRDTMRRELFIDGNKEWLDPADFVDWDEGKLSTNKAFQKIKAAQRQAEEDKAKAERERDMANRELDAARQNLADAYRDGEMRDAEVAQLKRQLAERPKPEVVEREVPPADYEDMKRQVAGTKRESERLNRKYQDVLKENMELQRQLEQANDTIVERGRNSSANRDIEQLINNIYTLLNRHGGKAQAFGDFHLVDRETQNECRKALVALDGFAQNLLIMTEETT